MSRAQRLLDLLQQLRCHRRPVAGPVLAHALGVSLRTLYRDIATLRAQGAQIDGEAGFGFVLQPGFMLPPLMFSDDELESLVLGLGWTAQRGPSPLDAAAESALAKIAAILPENLRARMTQGALLIGPTELPPRQAADLDLLRDAIARERKLRIAYIDSTTARSERIVWPIAIGLFDRTSVLAAWCEHRENFRHFRTDRIRQAIVLDERFPRRRQVLLQEWRRAEGIDADPQDRRKMTEKPNSGR